MLIKRNKKAEEKKKQIQESQGSQPASSLFGDPKTPHGEYSATNKTTIGQNISIEGVIRGNENLEIDGLMKGDIELKNNHITVGPKAKVEAEISAKNVTISGQMVGNIRATENVKFTKEANFTGEVKTKNISVENGAYLKAGIEMAHGAKKIPSSLGSESGPDSETIVLVNKAKTKE